MKATIMPVRKKLFIERTHVVKLHATNAPVRTNVASHGGYLSRTTRAEPAMAVVSLNVIGYMLPDMVGSM